MRKTAIIKQQHSWLWITATLVRARRWCFAQRCTPLHLCRCLRGISYSHQLLSSAEGEVFQLKVFHQRANSEVFCCGGPRKCQSLMQLRGDKPW